MKIKNLSLYLFGLMFLPMANSLADSYVQLSGSPLYNNSNNLSWTQIRLVCADPSQPNDPITASFPATSDLIANSTPNTLKWYGDQINASCAKHNVTIQARASDDNEIYQCPSIKNLDPSKYYTYAYQLNNDHTCTTY